VWKSDWSQWEKMAVEDGKEKPRKNKEGKKRDGSFSKQPFVEEKGWGKPEGNRLKGFSSNKKREG